MFDLDISLEWDASQDSIYLQQLEADLRQASDYLYDWSNGQMALGNVTVFHNAENWDYSHILVYATNRLRPFATIGGVVLTDTIDPDNPELRYGIGQVHMPSIWNRYGDPGGSLGEDWSLILAHELGHFLLFQDDTYLGLSEDDLLIAVDSCLGSAMGDVYDSRNSEFVFNDNFWNEECHKTLAAHELGRSEWDTLQNWYPWLQRPTTAANLTGPSRLPYELTQVTIVPPLTPTNVLADPAFFLDYEHNARSSSNARAFLQRNQAGSSSGIDSYEYIYDLGTAIGDQNRLLAKGAAPGDRLCVFDQARGQFGCEQVSVGDERLQLTNRDDWRPLLQLSPVNSTTFNLTVSGVPTSGLGLKARVYPLYGEAFTPTTLSQHGQVYSGALDLAYPSLSGWVQVYEDSPSNDRRETIASYSIGGNPGNSRSNGGGNSRSNGGGNSRSNGGGNSRSNGGGNSRSNGGGGARPGQAPLVSPDGQMIFFAGTELVFEEGDFYTVQSMAGLPPLPAGKTVIGQGYNLVKTHSAPELEGSISFQYRGDEVLAEGQPESLLAIHHWRDGQWQTLGTPVEARSVEYNLISAPSAGAGIYALLAGVTRPEITAVIPHRSVVMSTTQSITLSGRNLLQPLRVQAVGPTRTVTLTHRWVGSSALTAQISPTLPAGEYEIWLSNGHQPEEPDEWAVAPAPGLFALFDPAQACFYDFFKSGDSQWQAGGQWAIARLPSGNRALTDSPAGNYNSAIEPDLTLTTAITSELFSLNGCGNPVLRLRHDYVIDNRPPSEDVAKIELFAEGVWHELARYSGGDVFNPTAAEVEASEWARVNWKEVTLDLSPYTGTARLRFTLAVDQVGADKGWVLDDVMVQAGSPDAKIGGAVYLPVLIKEE